MKAVAIALTVLLAAEAGGVAFAQRAGGGGGGGGARSAPATREAPATRQAPATRPAPAAPAQRPAAPAAPAARPAGGGGGFNLGNDYQKPANRPAGEKNNNVSTANRGNNNNVNNVNRSTNNNNNVNNGNRNTNVNNNNVNVNRNTNVAVNNSRSGAVIVNPRYPPGPAWGWNRGSPWYPAPNYWGGGFWGSLAIGVASAAVFGAIVSSTTHQTVTSYQVQPNSPGATMLQNYGLQQVQCGPPNLVVIYGPSNSVICANPNATVAAGEYNLDTQQLSLVSI